ncbi:uncharacterized protein E0L32_010822 [Thyridium curvatum]|uniref:MARVEL domain-containing protein n=1 Tax=Thyridium curvatum TaxID=1093900 RepID=A0A507AQR5_9PEZI|nr:uncharacterized protein E0L32_010822 [Thyridium curvatum]TPX07228.1 hypothetical protein E0L32_010822 [Thyridium curvatum]
MALGFVPIIHVVAAVFAVIELGLTAYLVSTYATPWGGTRSPDVLNFMLFNAIWSLLVLAYVGVTPLYYTRVFHRLASLALEAVTMLFWFAGSIALAVDIGGPYSCGASGWCRAAQAAVAFGFFLWALFVALVALDTIEALRSRGHAVDHHHHNKPGVYAGA